MRSADEKYPCYICGKKIDWQKGDEYNGNIWGCEKCINNFCTKCFVDRFGEKAFLEMVESAPFILCPACYEKKEGDCE